ncbi:MAG: hypothetical protein FWD27_08330 [Coriobacteriia bacterium]|nr:hypothetical protein [Coriobacteriia bacterium]
MNYDKISSCLESGVEWQTWEDMPSREVLINKLIATRQLEAMYQREAKRLHREQQQLCEFLATMEA